MKDSHTKIKVDDIFADSTVVSVRAILFSLIFLIVIVIILRLSTIHPNYSQFFTLDETSFQLYINTILSVITSVVAAFIFAYIFTKRENDKLSKLQSLANNSYLVELLQSIDLYKGAYVEDYSATVKFCKHPSNALITVKIHFEYKKYPIKEPILITLYRITKDSNTEDLQTIVNERFTKEYVWQQDEKTFPVKIDPKTDYTIENVWVGKNKCLIDLIEKETEITAACKIPSNTDLLEPQTVEYQVKLPFEIESVLALTHDFPTYNASVSVDYREVSDMIDAYVLTLAGLQDNPIPHETDDPYLIRYKHRGWLSPQNGYVISWWRKQHGTNSEIKLEDERDN